jgi:hypothetical protein
MARLGIAFATLLISVSLLPGANAAQDAKRDGLLILARLGDISDGRCSCKDRCEEGRSVFSQGRTVTQCESKCQQAFSGCTKGEVRSNQRRDVTATQTRTPKSVQAPGPQRNFRECLREMGANIDPSYRVKLESGKTLRKWRLNSEAQTARLNDCVSRKAGT